MEIKLHANATTTPRTRKYLQESTKSDRELAQELGNTSYSGSAEDNIQLHKQVMQELARNGGKVPADLLD